LNLTFNIESYLKHKLIVAKKLRTSQAYLLE
jgi:hypothetical protein